uniref:PWI domain-containing protein n=1 Tax=Romanomermis culicivorax TaxID=13658 RepID=A0A915L2N5_ROMCU
VAESPKTVQPSRRTRRDSAASSETESSLLAGGGGLADDAVESTTDQQMEAVVKSWQTMKEEATTVDGQSSTPGSVGQASGPKATSFGFAGLKISGRGAAHASSSSLLATSAGGASVAAAADDDNDDDSLLTSKRQRPLVKLEYSEAEKQALEDQQPSLNVANMTVEEKRKAIKNLIEKIPTNREELFAYAINWPLVDQILIEKRLKPWVNKKIVEYIGEEEPSLVEFICQKVAEKCPPQTILEDISMVLDEEASVFVIKLWRLLIYEIEAKRFGLVKLD